MVPPQGCCWYWVGSSIEASEHGHGAGHGGHGTGDANIYGTPQISDLIEHSGGSSTEDGSGAVVGIFLRAAGHCRLNPMFMLQLMEETESTLLHQAVVDRLGWRGKRFPTSVLLRLRLVRAFNC